LPNTAATFLSPLKDEVHPIVVIIIITTIIMD
jgi:hypothetical protein